MSNAITTTIQTTPPKFMPLHPSKDEKSRLGRFAAWTNDNGYSWVNPDLEAYRDYLLESLAPRSVKAHLSTVRKALRRVKDNRNYLYDVAARIAPSVGIEGTSLTDLQPIVNEIAVRMENATAPGNSEVKVTTVKDKSDNEHIRLSAKQANELIAMPDRSTLAGLRDAAIIGLALATGLRAQELVDLKLDDLYGKLNGENAIIVNHGKGDKQRLVPYGAQITVLQLIHKWLNTADIESGFIFRGVTKGENGMVLDKPITTRTFERRLALYEVDEMTIHPHDLRRTYARQQYENGMDIVALRDNLGHEDIKTTQGYIGAMDVKKRLPRMGYQFL